MTERKPPGANWEPWIETQLRAAMEAGTFDNLPGAGKPIPNAFRVAGARQIRIYKEHPSMPGRAIYYGAPIP